jgi:hypothetical protein
VQNSELGDVVGKKTTKNYFSRYKDYIYITIIGICVGIGGYAGLMSVPRTEAQPVIEQRQPASYRLLTNPQEWLERRQERLQKEKDRLIREEKPDLYDGSAYEAKK